MCFTNNNSLCHSRLFTVKIQLMQNTEAKKLKVGGAILFHIHCPFPPKKEEKDLILVFAVSKL